RRRHTRFSRDWSSDVCSSDLKALIETYPDSQFAVLDVLKDEAASAVFLYEDQTRDVLYIVKRLALQSAGLREHKILARHTHPNKIGRASGREDGLRVKADDYI